MAKLAKIVGAIALVGVDGAVTRIPSNALQSGDACLCVMQDRFYIFRAMQTGAQESVGPFNDTNLPLILKPEDDVHTNWRWHLVSPSSFIQDLYATKSIIVNKVITHPNLQILNEEGTILAEFNKDGKVRVNELELMNASSNIVDNLRAEFIGDHHWTKVMKRDGTTTFTSPIVGVDPIDPDHLSTKDYVDRKLRDFNPTLYMKRDGSTSFENPVSGFDPNLPDHLATKRYVDEAIKAPERHLHSETHAIDGEDELKPEDIGALRIDGIASSARKLYNAHYINIEGDVEAPGVLFDGTSSITLKTKLKNTGLQASFVDHVSAVEDIHGATSLVSANRIIARDANGRARIATPSTLNDIANKRYVDEKHDTLKIYVDTKYNDLDGKITNEVDALNTRITNVNTKIDTTKAQLQNEINANISNAINAIDLPTTASLANAGIVKPDGITISIENDGTISVISKNLEIPSQPMDPIGGYRFINDLKQRPGYLPCNGHLIANFSQTYPEMKEYLQSTEGALRLCTQAQYDEMHNAIYYEYNESGLPDLILRWNGIGGATLMVWDQDANTLRLPDLQGMYLSNIGPNLTLNQPKPWNSRRLQGEFYASITGDMMSLSGNPDWNYMLHSAPISQDAFMRSSNSSSINPKVANGTFENQLVTFTYDNARSGPVGKDVNVNRVGGILCIYLGKKV